jgi:hypothetical protein
MIVFNKNWRIYNVSFKEFWVSDSSTSPPSTQIRLQHQRRHKFVYNTNADTNSSTTPTPTQIRLQHQRRHKFVYNTNVDTNFHLKNFLVLIFVMQHGKYNFVKFRFQFIKINLSTILMSYAQIYFSLIIFYEKFRSNKTHIFGIWGFGMTNCCLCYYMITVIWNECVMINFI